MAKSIKFKNSVYLDSSSIVYGRTTLKSIFEQQSIAITYNTNFVDVNSNGNLYNYCYKIGKIVFVNISTISFIDTPKVNDTDWIIKLPPPEKTLCGYLIGGRDAKGHTWRYALKQDGYMVCHYTEALLYGNVSNTQYCGFLIYRTA